MRARVFAATAALATAGAAFAGGCPGDCNGDGVANILDFVCFQGQWQDQTGAGDCDGNGEYNILDFVCFQGQWQDFAGGGCGGGADPLDDDFESYPLGNLCGQRGWEAWDDNPAACADVTDEEAFSGTQSLRLDADEDMVHLFDLEGGRWTARAMTLVPEDAEGAGYFIMLNTYQHFGPYDWAVQLELNADLGFIEAQEAGFEIATLVKGEWVELRIEIDLDADTADYFYNGEQFVFSNEWSDGGDARIECIDLFTPLMSFYYDDVSLTEGID
jgi:hypothetical protein